MKTTLEIPDFVFRRAKAVAAELGIPLREFVTQAVKEKLPARLTVRKSRGWKVLANCADCAEKPPESIV